MRFFFGVRVGNFVLTVICLVSIIVLCCTDSCSAEDGSIRSEIAELQARISKLEEKLAKQEKSNEMGALSLFEGINIGAGATFIVQGSVNANSTEKKGENAIDVTYSVDLELEKEFRDYAKVFIHLEAGGGGGLDNDEVTLFSGVNRDAGDTKNRVEVTETWYEHYLLDNKLTLTLGKLDPTCYLDDNAIANDETSQFLGPAFRNSAALEFPDDNGAGFRIGFIPLEWIEINAGVFDDNADWEDITDNIFCFGQVNFKPNFLGKEGNYRFYGWHDDSCHMELIDTSKKEEENFGFGLSFDQQLTDMLTCFVRFGWEDPGVSNIEYAWSAGARVTGKVWGRNEDVIGAAFGQNIPGSDYGKAGNPGHNETHVETYYNIHVNEHLSVSPGLQVIWNPNGAASGGEGRDDTVIVFSVRAQVDF